MTVLGAAVGKSGTAAGGREAHVRVHPPSRPPLRGQRRADTVPQRRGRVGRRRAGGEQERRDGWSGETRREEEERGGVEKRGEERRKGEEQEGRGGEEQRRRGEEQEGRRRGETRGGVERRDRRREEGEEQKRGDKQERGGEKKEEEGRREERRGKRSAGEGRREQDRIREKRERIGEGGGELDSPDERHHLLHDVFAEGDNNEELLQEETAALVWGIYRHQQADRRDPKPAVLDPGPPSLRGLQRLALEQPLAAITQDMT